MSLYPILWAAEHAPVRDAEERAILMALVMKGDFDGCNCFRSYGTLARVAKVDGKTAGRRCREMEKRGILRRQTQYLSKAWLSIPKEQRPVVWEVMIPAEWWGPTQLAEINEQRESLGRPAITPKNRPPLPEAPPKKTRADKGTKRPRKKTAEPADPGTTSPEGDPGTTSPHPPDSQSPPPGLQVPQPSESPSETPSLSPAQAAEPQPAPAPPVDEREKPEPPQQQEPQDEAETVTEAYATAYYDLRAVKASRSNVSAVRSAARELLAGGCTAAWLKQRAAELPRWGTDLGKHVEACLRAGGSLIPDQRSPEEPELPDACADHGWPPGLTDIARRWRDGPGGAYRCPACHPESPRYPSADVSPPPPKKPVFRNA